MKTILVVDDERSSLELTAACLEESGHSVEKTENGAGALQKLSEQDFDLMILDMKLPDMSGLEVLKRARLAVPEMPVLMLTAFASIETAVEAMKLGAIDYLSKPFSTDELSVKVAKALENKQLRDVNRYLLGALRDEMGMGEMIGQSPKMKEVYELVKQVAEVDTTVLILGESGVGKELVARAIHALSSRQGKPFVKANCSAFATGVLESELFGHEKGAFTSAVERQLGRFEVADGGTLFLDEIGDLPFDLQVKFLRVLQDKTFERVGSSKPIQVDVRILAATNRDLRKIVGDGKFRSDLFYRLNVVSIPVPPLRERKEDIPLLVNHFIVKYSRELKKDARQMEPGFLDCLMRYDWPGNVRELENAIERSVVLARSDTLQRQSLPMEVQTQTPTVSTDSASPLRLQEKEIILNILRAEHGNKLRAARRLGMGRTTLWRKLKQYHIE